MRDAAALQPEDTPRLGAPRDHEVFVAVEGLVGDVVTERRLGHRDRQVVYEIEPLSHEPVVRSNRDLDVEVARRTATRTDRAATGEPQRGAGVDARRDVDGVRLVGHDPAVARAVLARVLDDLALSAAGATHRRRHDLAEHRLTHRPNLARAPAVGTLRRAAALRRALAGTHVARDRGANTHVVLGTEDRLGERERGDRLEVGAAGRTRRTALATTER